MDDLLNWLDHRAKYNEDQRAIEATYKQDINSTAQKPLYQPNQKSNGQPTLRDLFGQQIGTNSEIKEKLATNDRILEDINVKMDSFSATIEDQLKFNKKIEEKIKQLAAVLPTTTDPEQVRAITTRGGRSTKDPPYPKGARRAPVIPLVAKEENNNEIEQDVQPQDTLQDHEMRQNFHDTNYILFPYRIRRPQSDEQFSKFVEVIHKLYVNIPLLDAIQVPTYAKYIRDILNKKRPLSSTELIKLTEECSAAILNKLLEKKKDPGCPTIDCSIGNQHFNNALCDLGASVSVMPAAVYHKLDHLALEPTSMCL
jgi:hypothetical protein